VADGGTAGSKVVGFPRFNPSTHTPDGTPIGALYASGYVHSYPAPPRDPAMDRARAEMGALVASTPSLEAVHRAQPGWLDYARNCRTVIDELSQQH
jgi:hypothetical protein